MGRGRAAPPIKDNDWGSVRRAINRLSTIILGSEATPTHTGLTLTGLTASKLIATDANKVFTSSVEGLSPVFTALTLSSIAAESSDVDKFLVDSSGVIKYRTGAEVLSDIGGQVQGDVLDDLNALGANVADNEFLVGIGAGVLAWESNTTVRTSLGLGTGDSPIFTGLTISGDSTVQSRTIRKSIHKISIVDNTATGVLRIETTDETGDEDGGAYAVKVSVLVGHNAIEDSGISAVLSFTAHFARVMQNQGTGANTAVSEISETASISTNSGVRDIGTVTMTVVENTEYQCDVKFTIDLTGSAVADAEVAGIAELNWTGFLTSPVMTAL